MENNFTNNYVRVFDPQNPANPYTDVINNRNKNVGEPPGSGPQLKASLIQSLQPFPQEFVRVSPTRNALFFFPSASITPMTLGVAGSPPIATYQPTAIGNFFTAGLQVNNVNNNSGT